MRNKSSFRIKLVDVSKKNLQLYAYNEHTRPFTVLSIIVAIVVQDSYKIIIFDELYTFTINTNEINHTF